jgi:hypothetical protein
VTDRFHGTIFCLRNKIPFISIEPYAPETNVNSKILSLIHDFGMVECYADVLQDNFRMSDFLGRAEDLRAGWERDFVPRVSDKLAEAHTTSLDFMGKIRSLLL